MSITVMRWANASGELRTIEFDAVELEAPSHEVAITEYPIEMGASLVDHIRIRALQLRMTVVVTNTPARTAPLSASGPVGEPRRGLSHMEGLTPTTDMTINVRQPILNAPPAAQLPTSVAGIQLTRTVPVRAVVRQYQPRGQHVQRVQFIYAELLQAQREAREFIVATSLLGDFDRMLLKSLRIDRDNRSGSGLRMQMELQQVTYAELFRRDVSGLLPKKPTQPRSQPAKDEGKKAPAKKKEITADKDSDLSKLIEAGKTAVRNF